MTYAAKTQQSRIFLKILPCKAMNYKNNALEKKTNAKIIIKIHLQEPENSKLRTKYLHDNLLTVISRPVLSCVPDCWHSLNELKLSISAD